MRFVLLLVLSAVPVAAQTPLFPDGTAATRATPHWRVGVSAGIANAAQTGTGSLSLERTVGGAAAVGARVAGYSGGGFKDDGTETAGGSLDVFGAIGTQDRVLDLRALAGLGAAVLDVTPSGLGCDDVESSCGERDAFTGVRPYLVAGVGIDLYPGAGIGLGAEVRVAAIGGPSNVSSGEIGLRVRLAR